MTNKDKTYNGWANRATWNVSLWLNNDESMYREMQKFARRFNVNAELAETLVRQNVWPIETPDGDKLSDVKWSEIARMMKKSVE